MSKTFWDGDSGSETMKIHLKQTVVRQLEHSHWSDNFDGDLVRLDIMDRGLGFTTLIETLIKQLGQLQW